MDFLRQIINSNSLESVLTLPPSFQDVQVEIIVLPVDNRKAEFIEKPVNHSAFGRLKAFANPSLMAEEDGAWD